MKERKAYTETALSLHRETLRSTKRKKTILINLMLFTRAWSDRRSDRDLSSLTHDRSGRTCVNDRIKFYQIYCFNVAVDKLKCLVIEVYTNVRD